MSTDDTILVEEAAQILERDKDSVYSLILRGELPATDTGTEIRVSRSAVLKYANARPKGFRTRDFYESLVRR